MPERKAVLGRCLGALFLDLRHGECLILAKHPMILSRASTVGVTIPGVFAEEIVCRLHKTAIAFERSSKCDEV